MPIWMAASAAKSEAAGDHDAGATCRHADGWVMTPAGLRDMANDAVAIYFLDVNLAAAFVARWCAAYRVEAVQARSGTTGCNLRSHCRRTNPVKPCSVSPAHMVTRADIGRPITELAQGKRPLV